jgi:hypothetical protein
MAFVKMYGKMWARNEENLDALKDLGHLEGVYVLHDGSMPVYVGRGVIWRRISSHERSHTRGQYWDYFSWFAINSKSNEKDVEAILLRILPYYLRVLNNQRANFQTAKKVDQENEQPKPVKKPKFVHKRRRPKSK